MMTSKPAFATVFERPESWYSYVPSPTARTSSLYSAGSSAPLHGPQVYVSPETDVTGNWTIVWIVMSTQPAPPLNVRVTLRVATYHSARSPTDLLAFCGSLIFT